MPQKLQIGKHRQKVPLIGSHRTPSTNPSATPTPLPSPQATHSIGELTPGSLGSSSTSSTTAPGTDTSSTTAPGTDTSSTSSTTAPGTDTSSTTAPGTDTSSTTAPGTDTSSTTQETQPETELEAKPPTPEEELAAFKTRVETTFGIKLDNSAGVKAMYRSFTKASGVTRKQVRKGAKPKEWTSEELGYLEEALKNYGPLLGANRPKELGAQPISTFSRTNVLIEPDEKTGAFSKDTSTLGITFGSGNISMFDKALKPTDFGTSGQQFRGTIEHELSHALIEDLPATIKGKQSTMIKKYAKDLDFWTSRYNSPYWTLKDGTPGSTNDFDDTKTRKAAQDAGVEAPVTDYGMTNAEEDLAEAMMYFFEDPGKLKADCPLRFQFILDNIKQYLDPEKVKAAEAI